MNFDIRPPNINGRTPAEQIRQLTAYLTKLTRQLQEAPPQQTVEVKKDTETTVRNTFRKLRVQRELTAEGGVNGVFSRSFYVSGVTSFTLRTRFSHWNGTGNTRQTFLISGCLNSIPLLGAVRVSDNGTSSWAGTEGITISTEGNGILRIHLPVTMFDYVLVQSPQEFYTM